MKIWLDDERSAPEGWFHVMTVEDFKFYLTCFQHNVDEVSLDHDLGTEETGYDAICWLEEKILTKQLEFPLSVKVNVHTANSSGRVPMEQAAQKIKEFYQSGDKNDR